MRLQPPLHWTAPFAALYRSALERFSLGERDPAELIDANGRLFLASLGLSPQALYDLVEDKYGVEEATLLAGFRRDYFWLEQNGRTSERRFTEAEFPRKTDQLEGIEWLPRLILKAQCFLKGELPRELMYGCAGDRSFCRKHFIELSEFLHFVWRAGETVADRSPAWLRERREAAESPAS